jgi:hypothetical protein
VVPGGGVRFLSLSTCVWGRLVPVSTSNMVLTVVYVMAGAWRGREASDLPVQCRKVPASWLNPGLLRQVGRAMSSECNR